MRISRRHFCISVAVSIGGSMFARRISADPTYDPRRDVIDMVNRAAEAISKHGFPRALNKSDDDIWFRPASGLYVFIIDKQGTLHLHPDRKMEGRNVAATTDPNGKAFIREMIASTLSAPDQGTWTDYVWPSPSGDEIAPKHTYSRLVGDYIIAAGYLARGV